MNRSRLVRGALALGALLLTATCSGRAYLRSSLPTLSGTLPLKGASADVTVTRDEYGIPSIWATTEDDAYRALGYAHAQDRLWQMEFFRRVADGRLAEIFGADLVETDRFMRTVGMGRAAGADVELLDETSRRVVDAYVAGVNAFLTSRSGALPPEFVILRIEPEPWTVRNTLSVAKIIAADLASFDLELEHQRALDKLGEAHARALGPPYPAYGPTILASKPAEGRLGLNTPPTRGVPLPRVDDTTREVLSAVVASHASNSWVIGGSKTASGKPIVANDTHLTLRAPSLFYLAAIHGGDVDRAGVTIPGIPGVILGRAKTFAWAFTDAMVDDVDFYVEKVDDEGRYLTPGGLVPLVRRDERIMVKDKPDVVHVVRSTRHGPLFSDVDKRGGGRALSMRWSAVEPARGMNALLRMNRATTWQSFLDASREFDTAKQNMVFGADDGTYGYVLLGKVPVRKKGDGMLPAPGWTDEYEWERFLTPEEKPFARSDAPPGGRPLTDGFIVTANHRQVGDDYPHLLTRIWASPFRAMRIRELLLRGDKFTANDVARQQMDVEDALAKRFLPRAITAAEAAGAAEAKEELSKWNAEARADSRGAAYFYLWLESLRKKIGEDEWAGDKMYFPRFVLIDTLDRGGSVWVDDVRTPEVESLDALARDAMREAAQTVGRKTWGDFHATHLEHPLGRVRALDALLGFNVGPVKRGGSSHTVNVAIYPEATPPFKNKDGASHREIVDMGSPDGSGSGFVVPTGQSGHPLSVHYRDLHRLWLDGRVAAMPLARPAADALAKHHLVLTRAP